MNLRLSQGGASGVLEMKAVDYFRAIKREDAIGDFNSALTLRDLYESLYRRRSNRQQLLEEEAVANMVELAHHGAITPEDLAPIQDLLDDMIRQGDIAATPVGRLLDALESLVVGFRR
jgi:hypothetical protein